jgi:hypothetical protein
MRDLASLTRYNQPKDNSPGSLQQADPKLIKSGELLAEFLKSVSDKQKGDYFILSDETNKKFPNSIEKQGADFDNMTTYLINNTPLDWPKTVQDEFIVVVNNWRILYDFDPIVRPDNSKSLFYLALFLIIILIIIYFLFIIYMLFYIFFRRSKSTSFGRR